MDKKVFIIAEAGVNHNGEIDKALQLVDIAMEAGADAVKFQTFKPGECTGKFAVKVDYLKKQSSSDETRFDITKKLALPYQDFRIIQEHANRKGIMFLTTPDGFESLDFVVDELDIPIIKVSSTELTHLSYLEKIAECRRPIILSTGMGFLGEIEKALEVIGKFHDKVTVLHCVSEYPVRFEDVNLRAMTTIKEAFNVPVGFSDHTVGYEAGISAVALGAVVIEKHFTIDKTLPGPDHSSSLAPQELKDFVEKIRNTELLLGNGRKMPSHSESKNIVGIRRSIVARRFLKKGTRLAADDIVCKRPGSGIHPYDLEKIIGMTVNKDIQEDEPVKWEYFHLL